MTTQTNLSATRKIAALLLALCVALGGLPGMEGRGEAADPLGFSIPDENFKQALLNLGIGSNGVITVADAAAVTTLFIPTLGISSLEGIEYFTNLKELKCYENRLTTLDVSQNTMLEYLYCQGNQLTTLDVSQNTALIELWCRANDLTSLDFSQNTALKYLYCEHNDITSLDVSSNPELELLSCVNNSLTTLDVSQNTALKYLDCAQNDLTSLDVSNNTELEHLHSAANPLTSLDVSNNPELEYLHCDANQLTSLDISQNEALVNFTCIANQLTSLDISQNLALDILSCKDNALTSLDVTGLNSLRILDASYNKMPSEASIIGLNKTVTIDFTFNPQYPDPDPDPDPDSEEDPGDNGGNPPAPLAPTITPTSLSLTAGESGMVQISLGTSYTGAEVVSSNPAVATVSPVSLGASGSVQVNAIAAGNADITITFTGGTPASSVTVPVTVTAAPLPPVNPAAPNDPAEPAEPTEPTEPAAPTTPTSPDTGGGSSDSGGESGGGAGSDWAASGANAPAPVTVQLAAKTAQEAVRNAIKAGEDSTKVKLRNPTTISRAALQAISGAANSLPGGAKVVADSLSADGKSVDVRITLDVKSAVDGLKSGAVKTLNLAASTTNVAAKQVKNTFEAFYRNPMQSIHFEMEGAWGQPVEVAMKFDPALNPANLFFYAYDKKNNTYTKIKDPNAWVDKNGYIHFTTEIAGDIVISEGELTRK